jgi:hypothetical protein
VDLLEPATELGVCIQTPLIPPHREGPFPLRSVIETCHEQRAEDTDDDTYEYRQLVQKGSPPQSVPITAPSQMARDLPVGYSVGIPDREIRRGGRALAAME